MNFEVWENIGGTILKNLFKDPRYPDNPDKAQTLPSFSTPPNRGDNYGARVTGYYQVNTYSREGIISNWALVAQSSEKTPFTSEIVGSNLGSDSLHSCEKSWSTLCQKSCVFSGYSCFLPLEMLTGLVEDQDRYSANPSIVAVLRNIGS